MENKFAKIPVASHGLHRHNYNYPWLSSINFGDVMPCYINPIRKGERDAPKAGVFSQLMPIAHNAFVTGRFNFKAIFVPYKFVWLPWYAFDSQTEFIGQDVEPFVPQRYPFVNNNLFGEAFLNEFGELDGDQYDYDIDYINPTNMTSQYYHLTPEGRRVLRIIGALGCMPTFVQKDERSINILPVLCYIKAFADYYFPTNYVGTSQYRKLSKFFNLTDVSLNSMVSDLMLALEVCSLNYYENSVFDLVWDNPVTPNPGVPTGRVEFPDVTDPSQDLGNNYVTNVNEIGAGTPSVVSDNGVGDGIMGFTKYLLDGLKAVSNWAHRHQLSGARLIDRFLVARGISLSNDSAQISYLMGQRNIEIEVSGVENNTDTDLGELAGRGVASSGNEPLSFECRPDDDGIFFVFVSPLPDANFPVLLDGFAVRSDWMDNYHAEYDKLGSAPVPSRVLMTNPSGSVSQAQDPTKNGVFGFLSQYWDEIQERPRLLGDFILPSRGSVELSAYHTFRFLNSAISQAHGYNFMRMLDANQFQRLFYSSEQENLMLFLRWYGSQYKEKLPLGDSYDWEDDELNRKVNIVVGGQKK